MRERERDFVVKINYQDNLKIFEIKFFVVDRRDSNQTMIINTERERLQKKTKTFKNLNIFLLFFMTMNVIFYHFLYFSLML